MEPVMADTEFADRFVLISGCSGGGKSTLLDQLGQRGYATVEEPGRRIVREEVKRGGSALPWKDLEAFLRRTLEVAMMDHAKATQLSGRVFFDRGLIDAAAALERVTGEPAAALLGASRLYNRRVFMAPPWPEIRITDQERRHDFEEAMIEYEHLLKVCPTLGYETVALAKVGVAERADFVLQMLEASG